MIYDFSILTSWIDELLLSWMPPFWALMVESLLVLIAGLTSFALLGMVLVYMERKVCAFFQVRLGPTRVGKWGSLQLVADMLKLLTKELLTPRGVDVLLYNIAPFIIILSAFLTFGALPFAKGLHAIDFNIGVFYLMAVSSLGVLGILLGGWASNNKYTVIGAMRSGAQVVSYELSVGMAYITMVAFAGSMQLSTIVESQADGWFLFKGHIPAFISFVVFLIASTAEANRGPFDLAEAESELIAGYHTEYSGLRFAFFYLAEYLNLFIASAIAATLFLGGWMPLHIGHWTAFNGVMDFIPPIVWFFGKAFFLVWVTMWFKWTFPRLRIDQLLTLEWKYLMPISFFNLLLMSVIILLGWHF